MRDPPGRLRSERLEYLKRSVNPGNSPRPSVADPTQTGGDSGVSLDPGPSREALLVAVEEVHRLLRPLPAVVPAARVEVDPPGALHLDAQRFHLPRPALHQRGHARVEGWQLRALRREEGPLGEERLAFLHRALGALIDVAHQRACGLERPLPRHAAYCASLSAESRIRERTRRLRCAPPTRSFRSS